ncbi:hypothetical protein D9758_018432 [Tetrapyrgos nigripes]|uniref:Uncharacterized protein n=1 Tax=Tetrapyrgos nigripes TaxID=182062 RepID=A0A8H5C5Y8_9AGAR|nr:hypothetical protein D9758_018432 [Tetrapyrgos nigripes]
MLHSTPAAPTSPLPSDDSQAAKTKSKHKHRRKKDKHHKKRKRTPSLEEAEQSIDAIDDLLDFDGPTAEEDPEPSGTSRKRKNPTAHSAPHKKQKSTTPEAQSRDSEDSDANPEAVSARRAGRWYARRGDLWIHPHDVIITGLQYSQDAQDESDDASKPKKKKKKATAMQERALEVYRRLLEDNDPNFRDLCKIFVASKDSEDGKDGEQEDEDVDADIEDDAVNFKALQSYTKKMQLHAARARSDDTGKLKRDMDRLLANPSARRVKIFSKTSMGWYDKYTARLLCPIDDLDDFDEDPDTYMDNVLTGTGSKHWSEWSTFLYDEGLVDNDNPAAGLFQGPLLVRVGKHIYFSTGLTKNTGAKTKSPVSRIHGMTEITAEDVAYCCVQTRFLLSSQTTWGHMDHGFNIKEFYWGIIRFFRTNRKGEVFDGAGGTKEMTVAPLKNSRFSRLMQDADPSESESEPDPDPEEESNEDNSEPPPSSRSASVLVEEDGDVTGTAARSGDESQEDA